MSMSFKSERGCKYQKAVGCKTCSYLIYKECSKYRLAHVQWLLDDIAPITLRKLKVVSPKRVYYFRSEVLAKQVAGKFAIAKNYKLKRLTFNQVMSITLDEGSEFVIPRALYIECKRQFTDNKIQSVFESFIDRATLAGATVFIYANANTVSSSDDWIKMVTDTKVSVKENKNQEQESEFD